MSDEIDNDSDFADTFSVLAGGNATQTEDATATLVEGDVSLTNQVEQVLEPVAETLPEENSEEAEETGEEEVNWEEKHNSLQAKYDSLDKQKRDNQSYNDGRFAELERKINEGSAPKVEATPPKEYTKEELSDMQYEDPDKYFKVMTDRQVQQQPQSNEMDIETKINVGVERGLHDDFDDMMAIAEKASLTQPQLVQEVIDSPNRAKAVYAIGKRISEAQEQTVDPVAYKEKIRQEILNELNGKKANPKTLHKVPGARAPVKSKRPPSDGFGFGTLAGAVGK